MKVYHQHYPGALGGKAMGLFRKLAGRCGKRKFRYVTDWSVVVCFISVILLHFTASRIISDEDFYSRLAQTKLWKGLNGSVRVKCNTFVVLAWNYPFPKLICKKRVGKMLWDSHSGIFEDAALWACGVFATGNSTRADLRRNWTALYVCNQHSNHKDENIMKRSEHRCYVLCFVRNNDLCEIVHRAINQCIYMTLQWLQRDWYFVSISTWSVCLRANGLLCHMFVFISYDACPTSLMYCFRHSVTCLLYKLS